MTTTIQTHGGGAQPASIDTSGKVTGGAALRVYGFDSEADAQAAGYVCEGGPAMSVALITDAQIASGAWRLEGDPSGTAVYTAPSNMPVEGGYAVPVYPVNGWGSAPAPVPPLFSSAEVGTVNASTVAVTFDQDVSASDYAAGVTIKVNGSGATISSATRQANHAIVYYVLSAAVAFGDVVTWEYVEASGNIVAEDDSTPLEDVTAQSVTNNVPDPIGTTLRADALAYWTMNEATGQTRIDSKGTTNLTDNGGMESVAGKIGNAALASAHFNTYLSTPSSNVVSLVSTHYFAHWFKMASDDVVHMFSKMGAGFEFDVSYSNTLTLTMVIGYAEIVFVPDANWHYLECYYDAAAHSIGIAVDHGSFITNNTFTLIPSADNFEVGSDSGSTGNTDVTIDEFGIWPRKLTQDERDYLWNSGAGRTLYP